MVNRRNYTEEAVEAARSVLLELVLILAEYQDDLVVVGGWVPELLIDQTKEKHVGSIDVDLAINHQNINDEVYKTIHDHLLSHGYTEGKQPFIFHRRVNNDIDVEIDFLSGEYGGTGKKHRTQRVQDMKPRKARGVDLAFEMTEKIVIRGTLPNGGEDSSEIQVASIAVFIVMKAFAMRGRLKEKDAWDIYYCISNYPGGIDELIEKLLPIVQKGLGEEALAILAEKFASPQAVGPTHVADFEAILDPEQRELIMRDAFERMNYILEKLRTGTS